MSHPWESRSSQLQTAFEAALQDYERQTGVALAEHPLTEQLRNCYSVDSISVLQEVGAFSRLRGGHEITKSINKSIKNIVPVLYGISAVNNLDQVVRLSLVCRTC